jgi:hypothetical protein
MLRALDPPSQLACRRLLISVVLVLLWAKALSPQSVWLGVAMLSAGCALIASGVALLCREKPLGPSLNRWDEVAALIGMHFLARLMVGGAT